MKRAAIGAVLLGLLLLGGLLSGRWMARQHEPLAALVEQAGRAAMVQQWEQAVSLAQQAESAWQAGRNRAAAFADHSPMEEIDEDFVSLSVFARSRDAVHFAATAGDLSRKLGAMADAHSLTWWNIL